MAHVVVSAETENWVAREPDPNDSWDNGDTGGRVSNVFAFVTDLRSPQYGASHGKDLDVQPGDTVYAVVADYESGCTFGRDGGHAQVLDVFTTGTEAKALAEAAMKPDTTETRWGEKVKVCGYNFTHDGVEYSRAWVGYFEDLQSLDVWQLTVKRAPKDPWSEDPKPGYKVGR